MRARSFCPYCGRVIHPPNQACYVHRDLLALDPNRGAVLASPDMEAAATGEEAPARKGTGS